MPRGRISQYCPFEDLTVSWHCSRAVCFYDQAQKIDFYKYGDQLALDAKDLGNDKSILNWQTCVTGGVDIPFYAASLSAYGLSMPFSWRFGPVLVAFLNNTSNDYCKQAYKVRSPLEFPDDFCSEDLRRVPRTQMRFIHYINSFVYRTTEKGLLLRRAIRMASWI